MHQYLMPLHDFSHYLIMITPSPRRFQINILQCTTMAVLGLHTSLHVVCVELTTVHPDDYIGDRLTV